MDCPRCGGERFPFAVPAALRDHVPTNPATVSLCTRCLHLEPVEDPPTRLTDYSTVSDALPDDHEAAAAMAIAAALLSSLARNRQHVDALLDRVERAGVDPILVLDRLDADPDLEPAFDIDARRQQLLQLRE